MEGDLGRTVATTSASLGFTGSSLLVLVLLLWLLLSELLSCFVVSSTLLLFDVVVEESGFSGMIKSALERIGIVGKG